MVIDMIAVLEDGTLPRAAWVPRDTRRALRVTAGVSMRIRLRVVRPTGAAVELANGDEIILSARSSTSRPSRAYVTRAAVPGDGGRDRHDVVIPESDTRHLGGCVGVWDVWLNRATGERDQIVGVATFDVDAGVTLPSAAPATPTPGAAATQDGTERSFRWVATVTSDTQTVSIPGVGMRDATYVVAGFYLRDPAPGDGPHPDARFPLAGRTATTFQVVTDSPIRAGSVYDVDLRDSAS